MQLNGALVEQVGSRFCLIQVAPSIVANMRHAAFMIIRCQRQFPELPIVLVSSAPGVEPEFFGCGDFCEQAKLLDLYSLNWTQYDLTTCSVIG